MLASSYHTCPDVVGTPGLFPVLDQLLDLVVHVPLAQGVLGLESPHQGPPVQTRNQGLQLAALPDAPQVPGKLKVPNLQSLEILESTNFTLFRNVVGPRMLRL